MLQTKRLYQSKRVMQSQERSHISGDVYYGIGRCKTMSDTNSDGGGEDVRQSRIPDYECLIPESSNKN